MNIDKANQLLGGPHPTEKTIKAAFARGVRALHPDTAKMRQMTEGRMIHATYTIGELQEARDLLLANAFNQVQEIPCKMCGGSGRVVGNGFGAPCAACQGTGHQR